ncbi:MAG TPA: hypothetical protein VHM70_29790 [Polyangiaceae bacterium]|nr:hypothetical protein [Polyangiaceae bacterium]
MLPEQPPRWLGAPSAAARGPSAGTGLAGGSSGDTVEALLDASVPSDARSLPDSRTRAQAFNAALSPDASPVADDALQLVDAATDWGSTNVTNSTFDHSQRAGDSTECKHDGTGLASLGGRRRYL